MKAIRKAVSYSFILSLLLNLCFNLGWGVLALILWLLHKWRGIPSVFTFIALGIWLFVALLITVVLRWSIRSDAPTPAARLRPLSQNGSASTGSADEQMSRWENRNSYSVREAVIVNTPNMQSAPDKPSTSGRDLWSEYAHDLWNAVLLIDVSEALFVEIMRQVNSGERDPCYDPIFLPHSFNDKMYYFLECLCDMGYIAYHDCKNLCEDVEASLNLSAERQDLPLIPPGLLEEHPMEQDTWKPENQVEMLGGRAAVYISRMVTGWRVFLIEDGSDGCYVGVVSHRNAGTFLHRLCSYFMELGCHYSAHLLDGK